MPSKLFTLSVCVLCAHVSVCVCVCVFVMQFKHMAISQFLLLLYGFKL